jgi:hypothetical protein
MVMSPLGAGTKNEYAGEDQQLFTRSSYFFPELLVIYLYGLFSYALSSSDCVESVVG